MSPRFSADKGAESREKHHSHLNPAGEEEDTVNSRKLGIMGRKVTCDGQSLGTADMRLLCETVK